MANAENILKDIFGYKTFRPLQQDIITNVLNKQDTIVVMPTGGGKSICYQIPALIFNGLTIVISPLISLMKDQVAQLSMLGIDAALLNSSLTNAEYELNYKKVKSGKAKLLYLAPESLGREDINLLFAISEVQCLAVDEAHCISEWGHDFRKEYRQLGSFRKKFPSAVCIGLTATATPRVQEDIASNLNMKAHKKFIASYNRENLFLEVIPKRNAFEQTLEYLNDHKDQAGIIYCFSRKQVDELSDALSSAGFSCRPYHAGLSDQERNENQDLFTRDEVNIIIATIAFGMGINKSNVRFVIHYDLPKHLESYYQEIGRSGRDGLRADCLLLFSYSDTAKINYFINQKEDEKEKLSAKIHLDAMVRYAESEKCRRITLINYFGEVYDNPSCGMCDNCIGHEKEKTDITVAAQKFLSAVARTGELYGAVYIIDLLLGSAAEKIMRSGHNKLTVYGIGKDYTRKQWQMIARQLVSGGYLIREAEFGSLKLNENSSLVLKNQIKVMGIVEEIKTVNKVLHPEYDIELFEILRRKRKQIADELNIPPYLIFSDKSLSEMAIYYPQDKAAFLQISGAGSWKYTKYGALFLKVIKNYCSSKGITGRRKVKQVKNSLSYGVKRFEEVSLAFNEGDSVEDLCRRYKVKPETIIGHLITFSTSGGQLDIERLKEILTLSESKWTEVFAAFDEFPVQAFKPVFEKFNGTVSYNDLRLLKIIYLSSDHSRQIASKQT